jgi:RNA polymerase sigma factor (sigma-70 family)
MPFPHPKPGRRTNQDVFFAYYSRLLEWALQITGNDRSEAEDLVHDFYLRVTRITRPIDEIEHLEHYLFRVLRHLYYARVRRAGRDPLNELSIVDYDSVEQGLAAADRRELLFARTHLMQICSHACQRKSTARSASILILRFFLGYHLLEVMKILQASRFSVDRSLQVARNEARLSLERPDILRCIVPNTKPSVSFSMREEDTQQLFAELQEAIFSATEGNCFDPEVLEHRYASVSEPTGMTTLELSHLVSCRVCLDRVNGILELPLLAERSPEDGIDRDNSSGPGDASGSGILRMRKSSPKKGPPLRKLERRARDLFEHRPASLEIVVDGEVRTSHRVTAEISELRLKLAHKEEPSFIEVLSEQGYCMAFLQVDEPVSAEKLEQAETALFSDDRSLFLTLRFAAEGPIVHVVYHDPVMAEEAEEDAIKNRVIEPAPLAIRIVETAGKPSRFSRAAQWLRLFGSKLKEFLPEMNPTLATALVLAAASLVCFVLWTRSGPHISPHDLLVRAQKQETSIAQSEPSGVVVQRVRIKTPARTTERTLYRDIQRQRHARNQALDASDAKLKAKLAGAGVDWDDPLSPVAYRDWRNRELIRNDSVQSAGDNLLTLTTNVNDGEVISESLTVRASDFHPVGKTVKLRDYGTVEIAEVNYSVLPWDAVNPNWFEPAGVTNPGVSSDTHPALIPRLPVSLTEGQLDEAELAARLVLNQVHADTGEQIEIVRAPSGIVVKGIVETEQRRRDLDDRLYTLPHVTTTLSSLERMKREQAQGADDITGIKVASMQAQATPLEAYYLKHGRNIDPLSKLSHQLFDAAFAADLESKTIDDLEHRFSQSSGMSLVTSATLTDLIFTHKQNLLAALQTEEGLLAETGISTAELKTNPPNNAGSLLLLNVAERNLALTKELALGNGDGRRSAESIVAEIATSLKDLHRAVRETQVVPPTSTRLDKRK